MRSGVAPRGFASAPGTLRRIGVGLDGSPESRVAPKLPCRLAHLANAFVRAITVVAAPVPTWPAIASNAVWAGAADAVPRRGERMLASAVAEFERDVTPKVAIGTAWNWC